MELSTTRETISSAATQETHRILLSYKVNYRFHKGSLCLYPKPKQLNSLNSILSLQNPFQYYSTIYALVFLMGSFLPSFQLIGSQILSENDVKEH
jgi:hypothetical protein